MDFPFNQKPLNLFSMGAHIVKYIHQGAQAVHNPHYSLYVSAVCFELFQICCLACCNKQQKVD